LNLKGKRVLVVGFARSGRAAITYLRGQGAIPFVVDRKDTPDLRAALEAERLEGKLGEHSEKDLEGADLVVASPGVPWDSPLLKAARNRGIMVSSEIDLFFRACPSKIAGITGTNGKTTTTALAAEVLKAGGLPVTRGGNIGEPVLDRVDRLGPEDWVVLELSSFQLESIHRPRLQIGTVLNVTEDHLDRHGSFANYVDIKARAVSFMEPGDHAVLNFDDQNCRRMAERTRGQVVPFSVDSSVAGVQVEDGWITIRARDLPERVMPAADVRLPGAHNLSNVLAAVGIGYAAGVLGERIAQAVSSFQGVEHRLELVGEFRGARWYNDSKATNPDSTAKALEAFKEPMVLIAGGRNKGIPLEPFARMIASRVKALVAMGETGPELAKLARQAGLAHVFEASDLVGAIQLAAENSTPGDVVVLSPGFASFDMFKDFEDRGRRFKSAVQQAFA
jgi:UDP-N-acetylmuramoylalanine--D-glutamate ligase